MEKTLNEKELIRSIADMMIDRPEYSILIFKDMKQILQIFPELESVVDFITSYDYDEHNYIEKLSNSIKNIDHIQTKSIFESALNYHVSNKKRLQ